MPQPQVYRQRSERRPSFLMPVQNATVNVGRTATFTCFVAHIGAFKVSLDFKMTSQSTNLECSSECEMTNFPLGTFSECQSIDGSFPLSRQRLKPPLCLTRRLQFPDRMRLFSRAQQTHERIEGRYSDRPRANLLNLLLSLRICWKRGERGIYVPARKPDSQGRERGIFAPEAFSFQENLSNGSMCENDNK